MGMTGSSGSSGVSSGGGEEPGLRGLSQPLPPPRPHPRWATDARAVRGAALWGQIAAI